MHEQRPLDHVSARGGSQPYSMECAPVLIYALPFDKVQVEIVQIGHVHIHIRVAKRLWVGEHPLFIDLTQRLLIKCQPFGNLQMSTDKGRVEF